MAASADVVMSFLEDLSNIVKHKAEEVWMDSTNIGIFWQYALRCSVCWNSSLNSMIHLSLDNISYAGI
jgi:hypothetical protein